MNADVCNHCGICTAHCDFLKKNNLCIGDTEKLRELAYHCFLCGKCTEVCPLEIDGRKLILEMRQKTVEEHEGKLPDSGYRFLFLEKKNYLFRNYKGARAKSVLFPGCNFPSFYPETTDYLIRILKPHGIGTVFDCCGKPIGELGLKKQEQMIIDHLKKRLAAHGIEEMIFLCPNCFHYLKGKLPVRMTSIYEKLIQLDLIEKMEGGKPVFVPCPERTNREILQQIQQLCGEPLQPIEDVQCCGLGGCASGLEPELVNGFLREIGKRGEVYTYCASCAGNLARHGVAETRHILTAVLQTHENPDIRNSMWHRIRTKWK